jgi:protein tyrosine phosphatase (PTP) superfamily phosphohydrolase (DUF442 family)
MKNNSATKIFALLLLITIIVIFISVYQNNLFLKIKQSDTKNNIQSKTLTPTPENKIIFHGPRFGTENVPNEYGFWSYAVVEKDKLSRSGQPNYNDFKYLKDKGYKTIINLRFKGEYSEITDDNEIPGVKDLNFEYYELPIKDGGIPTKEQALKFLEIVNDKTKIPIHIHCRGGFGRTGLITALYRYEINHWPMEKAIEESRLFEGGVDDTQRDWLFNWSKKSIQN